jgi:hypothetical protein
MLRQPLAFCLAMLGSSLAVPAQANPIMAGGWLSACQVPGTTHVLVGFECGESSDYGEDCSGGPLTRNGVAVPGEWSTSTENNADLGSGVTGSIHSDRLCDCNVPTGDHEYAMGSYWTTSITVVAGGPSAGSCLDAEACIAECKLQVVQDSGAPPPLPPDGGAVSDPDGGATYPPQSTGDPSDRGGCSVGSPCSVDLPWLLLALGLALAFRRRR